MTAPRERFRLLIEVRGDDVPAVITLRRFLKLALRAFGIKCVSIEAAPRPEGRAAAPQKALTMGLDRRAAPFRRPQPRAPKKLGSRPFCLPATTAGVRMIGSGRRE